jgi:hypothetical protein
MNYWQEALIIMMVFHLVGALAGTAIGMARRRR